MPKGIGNWKRGGWTGKRKSRLERFNERYYVVPNGCWEWMGRKDKDGYGVVGWVPFKTAHRYSYGTFVGEIPAGLWVLHSCDNPSCVNPKHLFLGTSRDNIDDMVAKGRSLKGEASVNARLTADQVIELRRQRVAGRTHSELSKMFNTCPANISIILAGKTWRHLEAD